MFENFNDDAHRVMVLAERTARELNHDYVGTEHILLGLVEEGSAVAEVLKTLAVDAEQVHCEVERLVQRGVQAVNAGTLPLTPRSKRVVEYAAAESHLMDEKSIGPEHLLLGLFREPDGVAGRALRNLGLELQELVAETFKTRVMQMKTVERAVRPVRASTAWKRKTREELLAHLANIYDEEQSRLHDPAAAMQAAAERFGNPAELSRELERSLPASERRGYFFEKLFGWRAPESAARYMLRQSLLSLAILAVLCSLIAIGTLPLTQGNDSRWQYARTLLALLSITPAVQFLLGLLYYKLRDALFGPIWASKSTPRVVVFAALAAVVTFTGGVGFIALTTWDAARVADSLWAMGVFAVAVAITTYVLARVRGKLEIRDTLWACMSLEG